MRKSNNTPPTFRVGSEKYGTAVMKDDEVLLYCETALENGASVEEALEDYKMMDALLHAERLHQVCGKITRKTSAGHYRKNSELMHTIERVVEARVNGAFKP